VNKNLSNNKDECAHYYILISAQHIYPVMGNSFIEDIYKCELCGHEKTEKRYPFCQSGSD